MVSANIFNNVRWPVCNTQRLSANQAAHTVTATTDEVPTIAGSPVTSEVNDSPTDPLIPSDQPSMESEFTVSPSVPLSAAPTSASLIAAVVSDSQTADTPAVSTTDLTPTTHPLTTDKEITHPPTTDKETTHPPPTDEETTHQQTTDEETAHQQTTHQLPATTGDIISSISTTTTSLLVPDNDAVYSADISDSRGQTVSPRTSRMGHAIIIVPAVFGFLQLLVIGALVGFLLQICWRKEVSFGAEKDKQTANNLELVYINRAYDEEQA